jgi:hypothetical protein
MTDRQTDPKPAPRPPTLRERFENNPLVVMVVACAAVASAVAGASAWVTDSLIEAERSRAQAAVIAAVAKATAELEGAHEGELSTIRAALSAQIDALKGHNATLEAEKAELVAALPGPGGGPSETGGFWLAQRFQPVLDMHGLMAEKDLTPVLDGRILVPAAVEAQTFHLLPAGGTLAYLIDGGFDPVAQAAATDDPLAEHLWLLGPVQSVAGHEVLRRFATHFVISRADGTALPGTETLDPAWRAFNADLEMRNQDTRLKGLRARLRQLETAGPGAIYAHYQTWLPDVTLEGSEEARNYFLNEMVLFFRVGTGPEAQVITVRAAFLSTRRSFHTEEVYGRVIARWSRMVFNLG